MAFRSRHKHKRMDALAGLATNPAHLATRPKLLRVPARQVAESVAQRFRQLLLLWAATRALPLEQHLAQAGGAIRHGQGAVEQACAQGRRSAWAEEGQWGAGTSTAAVLTDTAQERGSASNSSCSHASPEEAPKQ